MKNLILFLFFFYSFSLFGQVFPANKCIQYPKFIQKHNFNLANSALSTSEKRKKGLWLIEIDAKNKKVNKSLQLKTWDSAGFLGGMVFDHYGNLFTFPTPNVNIYDNPPKLSNIIYKVDGETGIMAPWIKLNTPDNLPDGNVFGIMGIAYSCFDNSIYASSIIGSTRDSIKGKLYRIDCEKHIIIDSISHFDGFGLNVLSINNNKFLLVGCARNSLLYYVQLDQNGGFMHSPKPMFSIEGLGPRGDDRIKKIVYNEKENILVISGYEFFFNLGATEQIHEQSYGFRLDPAKNNWYRVF